MQERQNTIGEWGAEREGGMCNDTNAPPPPGCCLGILHSATAGSARVDLAIAVEVTLENTNGQTNYLNGYQLNGFAPGLRRTL